MLHHSATPITAPGVTTPPPLERPPVAIGGLPEHTGTTLPLSDAQLDALELGVSQLHEGVGALLGAAGLHGGDRVDDRSLVVLSALGGGSDQLRGNPVDLFWSGARGPLQSWAIYNYNPFPVYVGPGPGGGTPLGSSWTVPPFTLLTATGNADTLSVGADPASIAGADATVTVVRSTAPIDHPAAYSLSAPVALLLASTLTPLAAFAAYVSSALPALPYATRVAGGVYTDQPGTVYLQAQITPGGQWRQVQSWAVAANTYATIDAPAVGAAHRITYANGATPQTIFELAAYLRRA